MTSEPEVPHHHLKQEVCTTRPPYRDGRHAKAVKVYTVNNESSFLIITGVPSVGAGGELSKLCSSFGPTEDFKALDEYPCEDKYTEVYLVKFQKIQSARFAKRKLDEYSFFGGSLHVFYAPEYETLQQTREKLQDRRRVVSQKIRQHSNDKSRPDQQTLGKPDSAQLEDSRVPLTYHDPLPLQHLHSLQPQHHGLPSSASSSDPSEEMQTLNSVNRHTTLPQQFHAVSTHKANPATETISSPPTTQSLSATEWEHQQSDDSTYQTFELPLPPKNMHNPQLSRNNISRQMYKYSMVPTAHASLPAGYDGRLEIPAYKTDSRGLSSKHISKIKVNATDSQGGQTATKPSQNFDLIIKEYKIHTPCPRFVPRQAVKATPTQGSAETELSMKARKSDSDDLRKNAFRLGKVQGPEELPGRKRLHSTPMQKSVNETISTIRSKISKIIGETVGKKTS